MDRLTQNIIDLITEYENGKTDIDIKQILYLMHQLSSKVDYVMKKVYELEIGTKKEVC